MAKPHCSIMEKLHCAAGIQLESVFIPPSIKPPSATKTLFLIGAGVRHFELEGTIQKVSATGLYLEEKAIESLATKWKGKTDVELMESDEFYNDITNGCFEKLVHVSALVLVTGKLFSETMAQMMATQWKANGTYDDVDAATIAKYLEILKDENLEPGGDSVLFVHLPNGSATLNIAKRGIIPEAPVAMLETKKWAKTQFNDIIGKNSIIPETRQSIASRLSDLLN